MPNEWWCPRRRAHTFVSSFVKVTLPVKSIQSGKVQGTYPIPLHRKTQVGGSPSVAAPTICVCEPKSVPLCDCKCSSATSPSNCDWQLHTRVFGQAKTRTCAKTKTGTAMRHCKKVSSNGNCKIYIMNRINNPSSLTLAKGQSLKNSCCCFHLVIWMIRKKPYYIIVFACEFGKFLRITTVG